MRVNLGGGQYRARNGLVWNADRAYSAGAWGCVDMADTDILTTNDAIAATEDDALYQSMRVGEMFRYRFDAEPGEYLVRIHFAEIYWDSPDAEAQDVYLMSRRVIRDYNIFDEVGHDVAVCKEFSLKLGKDQLEIRFEGRSLPMHSGARACALEVLPEGG